MPRQPIQWLITDTHFFHDKMFTEWKIRPRDYNEKIIAGMKKFIAPQDLLIHLGDVIFYEYPSLKNILNGIPCRKILTVGNHDRKPLNWYMNNGFDIAVKSFVIDDIIFSHKPIQQLPSDCRINIHGHFHNTDHRAKEPEYDKWYDPKVHRLLAIEYTNYEPVRLKEFVAVTDSGRVPYGTHGRIG